MSDEPPKLPDTMKELGVRRVEGSFNLHSGRLEEIQIEIIDRDKTERRWTIVYEVNLGNARLKLIPEIRNPYKLARILGRADSALPLLEPINGVQPWHARYVSSYEKSKKNIEEKLESMGVDPSEFDNVDPDNES